MNTMRPLPLLGGMSPAEFMRRHWQKKPLLVRQALPGLGGLVSPAQLFALAGRDDVESRLVVHGDAGWQLRSGPLPRRALPPLKQPRWTLLVQGLDLHLDAAQRVLSAFRFIPDARVDDLMVSYATDGGGVGPHLDSYDVFLIQLQGQRRWRIGRARDKRFVKDLPLKILRRFEPEHEWLLGPGDMLYLPPQWAHEGVAVGPCLTASVGFRAPARHELAHELLARLADGIERDKVATLYADRSQPATVSPAEIPPALRAFAVKAVHRALRQPAALDCVLGESLTEPKGQVWFQGSRQCDVSNGLELDRRTRMMYDATNVYINGESFAASGRDGRLMRRLADRRVLAAKEAAQLSVSARECVAEWMQAGWLHGAEV